MNNLNVYMLIKRLMEHKRFLLIAVTIEIIIYLIGAHIIMTPMYESSVKLYIGKSVQDDSPYNYGQIYEYNNMVKTYSMIIKSDSFIDDSLKSNGVYNVPSEDVQKKLKIQPRGNTQIIVLSYFDSNMNDCKKVLESIVKNLNNKENIVTNNTLFKTIGKVETVKKTVDRDIKVGMVITILIGMMANTEILFLRIKYNPRVESINQIRDDLNISVIGLIPYED